MEKWYFTCNSTPESTRTKFSKGLLSYYVLNLVRTRVVQLYLSHLTKFSTEVLEYYSCKFSAIRRWLSVRTKFSTYLGTYVHKYTVHCCSTTTRRSTCAAVLYAARALRCVHGSKELLAAKYGSAAP
jgi:hypothetical protein